MFINLAHFRHRYSQPVSYYALIIGWLLPVLPPEVSQSNPQSHLYLNIFLDLSS